jgi:hypothetical protein
MILRVVGARRLCPPASEAWLYQNPKTLADVQRGLREAAEGKAVASNSFAKYAGESQDQGEDP